MFRYVIKYTKNPFHDTNYGTVFENLKNSHVFLNSAVWHIGAKCKNSDFAISTITLQHKVKNKWRDI